MTQQTPTAPASRATSGARPAGVHPHLTGPGTLRLPAVPWAAAVSRRYLRQLLRAWQLAAVTETAQLMASELVANAVTAARAPEGGILLDERQPQSQQIELGVRRTEDSVIIEVTDPNPEPPVLRQAGAMDEGGRGLSIIEILGSRWGYYPSAGGGKVVWCEIAVDHTCSAGLLTLSMAGYPGVICARVPSGSEPVEPAPASQPRDQLSGVEDECASISLGARIGWHPIAWQHGSWPTSPAKGGACCATASSCSTTGAGCSRMAGPSALLARCWAAS